MEFAIFNDGVPSSVFYGSHPDHDVIRLISDEAIDELFPPSAEEVRLMCVWCLVLFLCICVPYA